MQQSSNQVPESGQGPHSEMVPGTFVLVAKNRFAALADKICKERGSLDLLFGQQTFVLELNERKANIMFYSGCLAMLCQLSPWEYQTSSSRQCWLAS